MTRVIKDLDRIPCKVMRQAFEDTGMSYTAASQAMGWGKCGTRLRRHLGTTKGRGVPYVEYDVAVLMIRSWRLDPVDYGI